MKTRKFSPLGVALMLTALAGCGTDWKLDVESDTEWYGVYGSVSPQGWTVTEVEGRGNRTIDVPDGDRVCFEFLQRGEGFLKVTLFDDGGGPLGVGAASGSEVETNVASGMVSACNDGSVPEHP